MRVFKGGGFLKIVSFEGEKLKEVVFSTKSECFTLTIISINSVLLGVMTYESLMLKYGDFLILLNNMCSTFFVIEILLKIVLLKRNFFKEPWNILDVSIVLLSLIPTTGSYSNFRMFRVFRVFRSLKSLRLVTKLNKLRVLIEAIGASLPNIAWTSLLLFIIYYIFAVTGTELFKAEFPELFGTLDKTFFTLFQVMTLESWSMEIARPVMLIYPLAVVYFVSFILITAFIVLNVVIGVVVKTISDETDRDQILKLQDKINSSNDLAIYLEYQELMKHMKTFEKLLELSFDNNTAQAQKKEKET